MKKIKLTPEAERLLRKHRKEFIRKFGREPGPNDFVFSDGSSPQPLDEATVDCAIVEAMRMAGVRPEIIYAYRKTDRVLTKEGYDQLSTKDRAEWDAAIDEYFEMEKAAESLPQ